MIAFPTPYFARGQIFRGRINYLAVPYNLQSGISPAFSSLDYRVSGDGLNFKKKGGKGDLENYRRSDQSGVFQCEGSIRFGNQLFLYGALWDDGNNSRAALFASNDSAKTFTRVETALEGPIGSGGARRIADATIFGSTLVFLSSTGELAWTSNGVDFSTRANVGFTGTGYRANSIAAGSNFLIAVGVNGQAFSLPSPDGVATARNLQFGTSAIQKVRAGNVLVAAGGGKISTSPLSSPTTWTARTDPVPAGLSEVLEYFSSKWFIGGFDGKWITSTDAITWSAPTQKPGTSRIRSLITEPGRMIAFYDGSVSASSDTVNWDVNVATGLDNTHYRAVKVAG